MNCCRLVATILGEHLYTLVGRGPLPLLILHYGPQSEHAA
jgi:hypothetical protein